MSVVYMKKALMVAFVVLLMCASAGQARAYTSYSNFFSIEEPSGWTITESTSGTVVVTFYEPTSNESFALIEIDVGQITGSTTLEEAAATLEQQFRTQFDSFQIISNPSTGVINGVDAYEITSSITTQGISFMLKTAIMVKNMRIYVVSYAATADRYQQFLSDFEDSLGTFTIHDPIPWYFWYVFVGAIVAAVSVIAVGLYIYKRRANTPIASY